MGKALSEKKIGSSFKYPDRDTILKWKTNTGIKQYQPVKAEGRGNGKPQATSAKDRPGAVF